ncbi:hypothetical protein I4U23_025585 [Adineta vaga]|nr:hypothetical protein I4U23_025585 [Adineta vaga]
MPESYLTTDIIVIIVLAVVIVIIGVCAFLVHFYWTKIGVADIWNTAKWSSMRSSIYQKMNHFSRPTTSKSLDQQSITRVSIRSGDIEHVSLQKKKSSPVITSYYTPTNVTFSNNNQTNKPVSVISCNDPIGQNHHGRKSGQAIDNTKNYNNYPANNRYNDLASTIQKQRF